MTHQPDHRPDALSSAEYRGKLLTKLNCLVAVLEVAIAKIAKSMDLPGANEDRLLKIRSNLENTLSICKRAKSTLERGRPGTLPSAKSGPGAKGTMSARDYVELSNIDEYRKFKNLPPISAEDLAALDFEELSRKLSDS